MAVRKCNPDFHLYREAQRADAAYESELRKCYGSKSSEARYSAKGKATARLKALYEAKRKADERWLTEMRKPNPSRKTPKKAAKRKPAKKTAKKKTAKRRRTASTPKRNRKGQFIKRS
jgi:hypothetical protein